ncbi:hypothetical protein L0U85_16055 [Glycomyces sp. L485]|uniref:hypothetical protein n=1 Tax=Glycomyces sp. L485 TaxID=2909235 RepID=UPI001F4A2758|nr:hypothetical protein [Glycomyces sp. L485]MCH7232355.1 hypothetical protein [Glycomyces sp. L485]
MSYPSQPSYTPPYGQPQPPRNTNLWLVGSAIIAVLVVIMTVTLLIIQRTEGSATAGGGEDPQTSSGNESTATEEETTEEETTEGDDVEESAGDGGGEYAGLKEETCDAYDLSAFEEYFGASLDADDTYRSASTSGDSGSVYCSFYTDEYDSLTISVYVEDDAEWARDFFDSDKEYREEDSDYEVSDYSDLGDAGYVSVYVDDSYESHELRVISGKIDVKVSSAIYSDESDRGEMPPMLAAHAAQAFDLFAAYA